MWAYNLVKSTMPVLYIQLFEKYFSYEIYFILNFIKHMGEQMKSLLVLLFYLIF